MYDMSARQFNTLQRKLRITHICWLVRQEDYAKTTEWSSMKLGWRMGLGPEQRGLLGLGGSMNTILVIHLQKYRSY